MIRINKEQQLTPEVIKKLVINHQGSQLPRMIKLENYYKGKNDILKRVMEDKSKPNNKVVHPFANYITDLLTGYFVGKPIAYNSPNDQLLESIHDIFRYNDEQDVNAELAKEASVYGVAYEMLYASEDGEIRFKRINPKEVITIYSNTADDELLYAIRYYKENDIFTDKDYYTIEVYSQKEIVVYTADETIDNLNLLTVVPHYFGLVPFAVYKNNEDEIGDFELVIGLIDAIDAMVSDSVNDTEYFTNAYLAIYGAEIDAEDLVAMKEKRTISLPYEGTKAEWLIKDVNDAQVENVKNRMVEDIHKFSKCPAMTDENFASNASGVAMKYKLMGTENLTSIKERKFKRGLQRRLELLCNILDLKGSKFDWRDIEIIFVRNIPVNAIEMADLVNKLRGIVSQETLIAQLPFIEDTAEEVKKVNEEKSAEVFAFQQGGLDNEQVLEEETDPDSK